MQNSTPAQSRLPSLDGWRAVSIFMVLGSHCIYATGFPTRLDPVFHWLFDGNLGVRFFFVISGFLITWLLLQEWNASGAIDLRKFYIRRCLRILPVYFAFLLVLLLMQCFGAAAQSRLSWTGCLTFTRNTFGTDAISGHLWSLSVEEQFYLLWPIALLLLLRGRNLRILATVVVLFILLGPMARGANGTAFFPEYPTLNLPHTFAGRLAFYVSVMAGRFLTAMDALAFGCLGAILLFYKPALVEAKLKLRPWPAAALGTVVIVLPHVINRLVGSPTVLFLQFGNTLQAVGFLILLLQSIVSPGYGLYRALNWRVISQIGVLSYSLYIWQQLVWTAPKNAGLDHVWWMGLWIAPLFVIALISYYAVERPLFRLRSLYRPKA